MPKVCALGLLLLGRAAESFESDAMTEVRDGGADDTVEQAAASIALLLDRGREACQLFAIDSSTPAELAACSSP